MVSIRALTRLFVAVGLFAGAVAAHSSSGPAAAAPPDPVRVFITLPSRPSPADEAAVRAAGGNVRYEFATSNTISVEVPEAALAGLRNNPRFSNVRPVPQVQLFEDQLVWGVDRVEADKVWGGAQGAVNVSPSGNAGAGVKVAVIDTGIDQTHPDLQANLAGGINFVDVTCTRYSFLGSCTRTKRLGPSNWDDDNGHGSHVAGIIAAADNGAGVIGVAPRASLYAIKALDYSGSGSLDDAIAGIEWASGLNGGTRADVVNMSFGCDCDDPALKAAVDGANAAGVLLIAAAGNSGPGADTVGYPAHYDSVVAVSATCGPTFSLYCSAPDAVASFSSTGPSVELAAPGDTIYSTWKDGGYMTESGTSMAAPHVAGAAALVKAANPGWSNSQVRQRLIDTALDLGPAGRDTGYGFGLVNAFAATFSGTNSAPVAQDGTATTNEDTSVNVTLTATDADGNALTYNVVTPPAHGTLSGTGASRSYTPAANFNGSDSFTFTANDGIATSNVATVSITVNPVNDAPDAVNDSAQTPVDTPLTLAVLANDKDVDGDAVTLVSAGPASSKGGTAVANPDGTVTYTPPAGFSGTDTFTYSISDGHGGSDSATVTIAVGASANTTHIADLDASTATLFYLWRGIVTILVLDQNGQPVANAYVYGNFSQGLTGSGACLTGANGTCQFGSNWASSGNSGVFTVTNVSKSGYTYVASLNADPDGDSDGTTITVVLP